MCGKVDGETTGAGSLLASSISRRASAMSASRRLRVLFAGSGEAGVRSRSVSSAATRSNRARASGSRRAVSEMVSPVERRPPREHLVEHAPERPDVASACRRAVPRACSGLMYAAVPRMTPASCAVHASSVGDWVRSDRPRSTHSPPSVLASPKSSTLTVPSGRDLDVRGLQIAMDDAPLMRRLERIRNLPRDGQRLLERDRAAAMRSASVGPSTSSMTSAWTPPESSRP